MLILKLSIFLFFLLALDTSLAVLSHNDYD